MLEKCGCFLPLVQQKYGFIESFTKAQSRFIKSYNRYQKRNVFIIWLSIEPIKYYSCFCWSIKRQKSFHTIWNIVYVNICQLKKQNFYFCYFMIITFQPARFKLFAVWIVRCFKLGVFSGRRNIAYIQCNQIKSSATVRAFFFLCMQQPYFLS